MNTCKNHMDDGGDTLVIGGKLVVEAGAEADGLETGGGMEFLYGTAAPAAMGKAGDVYLNTTNGDFYKNLDGTWTKVGNLKGPTGATGAAGTQGVKGDPGAAGATGATGAAGVSVTDITSDGTNLTFKLSNNTTKVIPWPAQG